jgi:GNAT superfamily N-acetyltransferase
MMPDTTADRDAAIRPLARENLEAVVAIDAALEGRSRRDYFERRLKAALLEPALHAQFAATDDAGLAGYILARVLEGEFGLTEPGLRLEVLGVRDDARGHGVGRLLFDALVAWARRHGIRDLRTQATWNDHRMLRWLDAMGFTLAPNHVVDCAVHGGGYTPERDDPVALHGDPDAVHEIDYGGRPGNDFEHLARDSADVRGMTRDDLAEIVRIDRDITGRERRDYMQHKLNETMVDSAIRVSLTARMDGAIAGFLMARADLGDFGRTEPVAVIDTIGVDPGRAHHGVGHALLSQLFVNLGALRIERVETVVAPSDLGLLGFLYGAGFVPSQRLPFMCRLDATQ